MRMVCDTWRGVISARLDFRKNYRIHSYIIVTPDLYLMRIIQSHVVLVTLDKRRMNT